ncbi:MAG: lipopolysaccharide biosynthesis protein [Alphaproteobacteria bacterium]
MKQLFHPPLKKYHLVAASAWAARAITAICQFYVIRLISAQHGSAAYALFALLASWLPWLLLADAGIGQALQNRLSAARVNNLPMLPLLAQAMGMVALTGLIFVFLLAPLAYFLLPQFVHLPSETNQPLNDWQLLLAISFMIGVGSAFVGLIQRYWYACQQGYFVHIGTALASILGCVLVGFSHVDVASCFLLFYLPSIILPLPFLLHAGFKGVVAMKKQPSTLQNTHIWNDRNFWQQSLQFCGLGIMTAMVLNIDMLLLSSHADRPENMAEYAVLVRVFSIPLIAFMSWLQALWPVLAEEFAKKNSTILRQHLRLSIIRLNVILPLFIIILAFTAPYITRLLLHSPNYQPSPYLWVMVLAYGGFMLLRLNANIFATALQAMGQMKALLLIQPLQIVISVLLQWYLGKIWGGAGIALGLMLSFLFTVSWYLPRKLKKILETL